MKRGFAIRALIHPADFGCGPRDCVPRFRLPDLPRFEPKSARVSARQLIDVEPQMNHLVF